MNLWGVNEILRKSSLLGNGSVWERQETDKIKSSGNHLGETPGRVGHFLLVLFTFAPTTWASFNDLLK